MTGSDVAPFAVAPLTQRGELSISLRVRRLKRALGIALGAG